VFISFVGLTFETKAISPLSYGATNITVLSKVPSGLWCYFPGRM